VREIRLYDSLTRQLVPVSAGDAIRVEVRAAPTGSDGVDVGSTRPLVLFSFLERFLQREGFGTKFLFDSPSGEDMLYELSEEHEPLSATGPGGEHDSEHDTEMSLLEVPRSDVDRWVNVCFGAGRDGEEWEPPPPSERILLSDALKHFGHPAVALYLLGTHYSLPLGDASTGLHTGSKNAVRIREAAQRLVPDQPSPPDMRHYIEAFRDALADDLDTPLAFVVMFEWVLEAERRGGDVGDNDLRVMLEVLELDGLAAPARVP
jgi:cysteinyl-tRNA synthetase